MSVTTGIAPTPGQVSARTPTSGQGSVRTNTLTLVDMEEGQLPASKSALTLDHTKPEQDMQDQTDSQLQPYEAASARSSRAAPASPQRGGLRITSWRIFVTTTIVVFASYKAWSIRLGQSAALTNWECLAGVSGLLIWYWGSLLEQENPALAPWLFIRDFSVVPAFLWELAGSLPFRIFIMGSSLMSTGDERPRYMRIAMLCFAGIAPLLGVPSAATSTWISRFINLLDGPWLPRFAAFRRADWALESLGQLFVALIAVPLNIAATTVLLQYEPHSSLEGCILAMGFLGSTTASLILPYLACGLMNMVLRLIRPAR
ncbi:hypothetical protein B0H11DRAFT_2094469 [Mycena galericulata]|nr:hypothetical protein B0H11DRAFT_2094469 [Mycena galericulata]